MRNAIIIAIALTACGEARKVGRIVSVEQKKAQAFFYPDVTEQQEQTYYTPPGSIDADSQAYIDDFRAQAASRHIPVDYTKLVAVTYQDNPSVTVAGKEEAIWGLCQIYYEPDGSAVSSVLLNSELNTSVPPEEKKLIIDHELGHCLYGLGHTTRDQSNILQIMFWSSGQEQIDNATEYDSNWSTYLDFLFYKKAEEISP